MANILIENKEIYERRKSIYTEGKKTSESVAATALYGFESTTA